MSIKNMGKIDSDIDLTLYKITKNNGHDKAKLH